tara:strand:- start:532 stop:771 length:240 start_codon:yes stop_codon:yes gene_type:complete
MMRLNAGIVKTPDLRPGRVGGSKLWIFKPGNLGTILLGMYWTSTIRFFLMLYALAVVELVVLEDADIPSSNSHPERVAR